jgi:hypothetical protein
VSVNVDDLEARIAENEKHGLYTSPAVKELIAELRERRAQVDDYRMMIDGLENAAREERAAVVAWLRREFEDKRTRYAADAIERGEHRREEEP